MIINDVAATLDSVFLDLFTHYHLAHHFPDVLTAGRAEALLIAAYGKGLKLETTLEEEE